VTETFDISPDMAERMARSTPQSAALGLRALSAGAGVAIMAVPWRADLVGDPETGVIAGGVVTTLLDQACGMAVSSLAVSQGRFSGLATLDLRIDYMRGAIPGREIKARAHCYKLTKAIGFVRATAFEDDESDPIATAQAAFALTTAHPPAGA
jgi:uncharacterized protein (TIGR00369 family)